MRKKSIIRIFVKKTTGFMQELQKRKSFQTTTSSLPGRTDHASNPHGGVAVIVKSNIAGVKVDTETTTEFTAASRHLQIQ